MNIDWDNVLLEAQKQKNIEVGDMLPFITFISLLHFLNTYFNPNSLEDKN